MSLYPRARLRLLPENNTQPRIKPRAAILHSAGGGSELYGWWMNPQSKGLESHFWIGWEGEVVQYIDTEVRADANGEANSFAVSIETASTVHATEPWNPAQIAAIVELLDWLCTEHAIPRTRMKTKTSAGIGWHVMFGAPGPWTKARGKVCPGPARIRQVTDTIIPRLADKALAGLTDKDPFMALSDAEQRELLTNTRTLVQTSPRKAYAVRDPRDGRVWVMGSAGRWWVRNMDALSLLIWNGQVQGFGPEGVPMGTVAQIEGTAEVDAPPEIGDLIEATTAAAKG